MGKSFIPKVEHIFCYEEGSKYIRNIHGSVEAVERLFDLLAALVQGRPSSSAGIPTDNGLAATLLILREFMHHLQFATIRIVSD